MKNLKIYKKLQTHLNKTTPFGFPASIKSDISIKLLKHIFTPEEAKIACFLTHKPETLEIISERIKDSIATFIESDEQLEKRLDRMYKKGGIESKIGEGVRYYCNAPLVVGIYEMQINRLTPEFLEDFNEYSNDINFGLEFLSNLKTPQMRTIPIQKSISLINHVSHFDEVEKLFERAAPPFVVLECICRKKRKIEGKSCNITERKETCLAVGGIASSCLLMGIGREITKNEAIAIIEKNQKDGLVLQPSNTENLEFICSCCGCCCGMLEIHHKLPIPIEFWSSNFYAVIDTGRCNGCGVCERRCQVGAVTVDKHPDNYRVYNKNLDSNEAIISNRAIIDLNMCIGCGLCVTTCPKQAISLVKKAQEIKPPQDREALHEVIAADKQNSDSLGLQGTIRKLNVIGKLVKGVIKSGKTELLRRNY